MVPDNPSVDLAGDITALLAELREVREDLAEQLKQIDQRLSDIEKRLSGIHWRQCALIAQQQQTRRTRPLSR